MTRTEFLERQQDILATIRFYHDRLKYQSERRQTLLDQIADSYATTASIDEEIARCRKELTALVAEKEARQ